MRLFIAIVLGSLALVFTFNSWINLAGGGDAARRVHDLAHDQTAEDVVVAELIFDQRAWLRARIRPSATCPDVLVAGSSTVGRLRSEFFEGSMLNAWLTGPTVQDFEALTVLLDRAHCRPTLAIVGVDPFFFNQRFNSERWRTLRREQSMFDGDPDEASVLLSESMAFWKSFKDRLSFVTTRDSIVHWRKFMGAASEARIVKQRELASDCNRRRSGPLMIRHADGHFSICESDRLTPSRIREIASSYLARDFHSMRSWATIDRARWIRFRIVIEAWERRGMSVVLVAPPYHPMTYETLQANARVAALLDELDQLLRTMDRPPMVRFVNLRNPAAAECSSDEFTDSHHPSDACARRVANHLLVKLRRNAS